MISVLLPTVRPNHIGPCLDALASASSYPFEVVVVADFDNPEPDRYRPLHLIWVKTQRKGPVDAVNVAYAWSHGTWIYLHNDQSCLEPCALDRLLEEALKTPTAIVTPLHEPSFNFQYYGHPFPPFPFAHRTVFDTLGGLLDPAFRGFYADPDLGMRAHRAGVDVRVVPEAVIHHHNDTSLPDYTANVNAYFLKDRETFRARWDHLGEFSDPR